MVAAESVQRAEAGDEVGDLRAGPGHPGLLFLGTGADPLGHHTQDRQDHHRSHDHQQSQPEVRQSQCDGRDQHRHHRADQQRHHLDDVGGRVGVLGGDGQHLAGLQIDVPVHRLESARRDLHPPAVRLGRVGLLQDAHAEPPRQGHGRDDHGQRADRHPERTGAPVLQGVLDDQAERDGEGGLARLVQAHEDGAPGHGTQVAAQGGAEDTGSLEGPVWVRSSHRGDRQSLRGFAG